MTARVHSRVPTGKSLGAARRFFRGSGYVFRGAATLFRGKGLLRWAVLPIAINCLVFAGATALAVWAAAHYAGQAVDGAWGVVLAWAAGIGASIVMAAAGILTFGLAANVIAAPFNELLSQATERLMTGETGEVKDRPFAADMARAGLAAVKLFLLEMAVTAPALLLLFVPVIGAVLFAAPASYFLALAFLDYPLDRRKLSLKEKVRRTERHMAEVLGFGLPAYLLMLVPVVNLVTVPAAVAGATRLYLDVMGEDEGVKEAVGETG
ncbi:MAG: EI24 domain-containing protein [Planctomycetes bacterium]|nr:EI24 domain-containing protein [Planctomycetota bacterium]